MKATGRPHSLQWRLSLALFLVIVLTGALAGGLSFFWALHDANEILDGTLEDTASLIASGRMAVPQVPAHLPGSEPDNDVLVVPLPAGSSARSSGMAGLLAGLPDGLHTIASDGRSWRVLVTPVRDGGRLAIAQQTEVRDEIAQHSAIRTLIPLLLLVPLLILLVREVVRRTLRPVSRLAQHVDSNPMAHAALLPELAIPLEIQPFVHSIRRLLRELTEALEQQQRFVANAAHELRSPMAALQLQAANVESVLRDPVARERLADLQRGIARMQHLLDQLLSMARSEGPAAPHSPVDLADAAKEVLAGMVADAQARGIDLGMDRCEPGVRIDATPVDVATMLQNVVENAVKYCPPGAVVTLSVFADGDDAVLVVADDGPGISAEHLPNVLEPFYRVPGTGAAGTGLGLSIVAAIAKRLGGQLSLQSGGPAPGVRFEYRQRRSR